MRDAQTFLEGLKDGREVWYRGQRVDDVVEHDVLGTAARHAVVRGAKAHTSCTPYVDEVIVIPTRALAEDEQEWAVSFAVPVATTGLRLLCSDYLHTEDTPWTRPISTRHKMIETLTVFDDVFV